MLDLFDEKRIVRITRILGAFIFGVGLLEFIIFVFGSIAAGDVIPPPLTVPYLAAGFLAYLYPQAILFIYYAVVWGMGTLYGVLISGRVTFFAIIYLLMAVFFAWLYAYLSNAERELGITPDPQALALFPKVAAAAGVIALLLSPLTALGLFGSAPSVQSAVLALGLGAAAVVTTDDQQIFSIAGVGLGAVALIIWAVLTLV